MPEAAALQVEDLASPRALHVGLESQLDGARVGLDAADPHDFVEQALRKHKIRTFHVHSVHHGGMVVQAGRVDPEVRNLKYYDRTVCAS